MLYAKIIAESELLQPAFNEIHKFCFQHWSRGHSTCGTGSSAPVYTNILKMCYCIHMHVCVYTCDIYILNIAQSRVRIQTQESSFLSSHVRAL